MLFQQTQSPVHFECLAIWDLVAPLLLRMMQNRPQRIREGTQSVNIRRILLSARLVEIAIYWRLQRVDIQQRLHNHVVRVAQYLLRQRLIHLVLLLRYQHLDRFERFCREVVQLLSLFLVLALGPLEQDVASGDCQALEELVHSRQLAAVPFTELVAEPGEVVAIEGDAFLAIAQDELFVATVLLLSSLQILRLVVVLCALDPGLFRTASEPGDGVVDEDHLLEVERFADHFVETVLLLPIPSNPCLISLLHPDALYIREGLELDWLDPAPVLQQYLLHVRVRIAQRVVWYWLTGSNPLHRLHVALTLHAPHASFCFFD